MALRRVATGFLRSHPLPSGGSGASKASTVWRQVATATGGYQRQVATGFLRSHPLPSGGSGASKTSTVWRQVATSDRWLPASYVAVRCQAVDGGA